MMTIFCFHEVADDEFKGNRIAYWVLWIYVFKSFFAGFVHMFASDGGAQSIGSVTSIVSHWVL